MPSISAHDYAEGRRVAALGNAGEVTANMIGHGAETKAKDYDGKSPLEGATAQGSQAVVATSRKQMGEQLGHLAGHRCRLCLFVPARGSAAMY